jgi:hypothetical protein
MAQRNQRGWLKKESRARGDTWVVVLPHESKVRRQASREQDSDWTSQRPSRQGKCMGRDQKAASPDKQGGFKERDNIWGSSTTLRRTRVGGPHGEYPSEGSHDSLILRTRAS